MARFKDSLLSENLRLNTNCGGNPTVKLVIRVACLD